MKKILKKVWLFFSFICVLLVSGIATLIFLQQDNLHIKQSVQSIGSWYKQFKGGSVNNTLLKTGSITGPSFGPVSFFSQEGKKVRIPLGGQNNEALVQPSDIIYAYIKNRKVHLVCLNRVFTSNAKLSEIYEWLEGFGHFFKTRQHIINLHHVVEFTSDGFQRYSLNLKMTPTREEAHSPTINIPNDKRGVFQDALDNLVVNPKSNNRVELGGY